MINDFKLKACLMPSLYFLFYRDKVKYIDLLFCWIFSFWFSILPSPNGFDLHLYVMILCANTRAAYQRFYLFQLYMFWVNDIPYTDVHIHPPLIVKDWLVDKRIPLYFQLL